MDKEIKVSPCMSDDEKYKVIDIGKSVHIKMYDGTIRIFIDVQ